MDRVALTYKGKPLPKGYGDYDLALRARWAEARGLSQVKHGNWAKLIGKQEIVGVPGARYYGGLPGDDHCSLWVRGKRPMAWVSQPYHLYPDTLRAMLAAADKYGLDFTVTTGSWWYPGRTLFVEWHRKGDGLLLPVTKDAA